MANTVKRKSADALTGFHPVYLVQPLFNACFYGIKSIFVLYAIQRLSLPKAEAVTFFASFMSLCYVTPLVGGYIAGRWISVQDTVLLGGALAVVGLLLFAFPPSFDGCLVGLALFALGSGCFKPSLLAVIGLLFKNPHDPGKDRLYSNTYIWINVTATFMPILCASVQAFYGWEAAFITVIGVFVGVMMLYYKAMRPYIYAEKTPLSKFKLLGSFVCLLALIYAFLKNPLSFNVMMGGIAFCSAIYLIWVLRQSSPSERKGIWVAMLYIALFSVSTIVFEQSGSSMMMFYDKAVDRNVMGFLLPPGDLFALEALWIIFIGIAAIILPKWYLDKASPANPFVKMGFGFLWVTLSFWVLSQGVPEDGASLVPLSWIVLSAFCCALGEFWIAPVSQSQVSQHSPQRLQGMMMSFWTLAIAFGHWFAGSIAQYSLVDPSVAGIGHYKSFFFNVGLLPLGVGAFVLLVCVIISRIQMRKAG